MYIAFDSDDFYILEFTLKFTEAPEVYSEKL